MGLKNLTPKALKHYNDAEKTYKKTRSVYLSGAPEHLEQVRLGAIYLGQHLGKALKAGLPLNSTHAKCMFMARDALISAYWRRRLQNLRKP